MALPQLARRSPAASWLQSAGLARPLWRPVRVVAPGLVQRGGSDGQGRRGFFGFPSRCVFEFARTSNLNKLTPPFSAQQRWDELLSDPARQDEPGGPRRCSARAYFSVAIAEPRPAHP